MEEPDLEQWTVYDGEGYRHALSPRPDGAVTIGARVGVAEIDALSKRLRTFLEWARPEQRWESASFDEMLEATEAAHRKRETLDARFSTILLASLAVASVIVWSLLRR